MDIQMVIGNLDPLLGEDLVYLLQNLKVGVPEVLRPGPEPDVVLNGAVLIGGHHRLGGRIVQHIGRTGDSLETGCLYLARIAGVRYADPVIRPAAAQHTVVDDLPGGQLAVGQHEPLEVSSFVWVRPISSTVPSPSSVST